MNPSFITLWEMKNSRGISCQRNNHGRCINRYDNKIVSISKFGVKRLIRIEDVWKTWGNG